ncbi:MAG: methyl-accepting chemotaxis protein [Opitutales bacterium]|nr:methyl-accepting chemotaxis protein [Opitutales bacterium]
MGIRLKFLVYVVLPLLIVTIAASLYTSSKNFSLLSSTTKQRFVLDTEIVADKVSSENVRGISIAKSASVSAEILFGNRVSTVKMMKKLIEAFPSFFGAGISYSINADFNDFRADLGLKNIREGKDAYSDGALDSYDFSTNKTEVSIDEWIAASEGGRFNAIWQKPDGDLLLSPLTESETATYSSALRKRVEASEKDLYVVTEPYISSGKNMIVEYASAIMADDRFSGQVVFVSDMQRIQSILTSMSVSNEEQYFLISSQDRVIASSKFDNMKSILVGDIYTDNAGNLVQNFLREEKGLLVRDESIVAKIDLTKYNNFYSEILRYACMQAKTTITTDLSEKKISIYKDPKTGLRYYVDVAHVRAGKWIVVHICPEIDFFSVVMSSFLGDVALISFVILICIFGFIMISRFTRRIAQSRSVIDNLSSGVFVEVTGKSVDDESGRLARSLAKAIKKISIVFSKIESLQKDLSETSKNITLILENYAFQSNSIDLQTIKISNALKSAIENNKGVRQNIDKLENSVSTALDFSENVRKDFSYIDDLIGEFSRNATSSMRRNANLNDRIKNITGISADISKVADESNLLSLNASIEAEKSGKYGSGFAVIAREISRLSESVSMSSFDMKNIVRDVENAISYDSSESGRLLENLNDFTSKYSKILKNIDVIVEQIKSAIPAKDLLETNSSTNDSEIGKAFDLLVELADSISTLNTLRSELMSASEHLSEKVRKIEITVSNLKSED